MKQSTQIGSHEDDGPDSGSMHAEFAPERDLRFTIRIVCANLLCLLKCQLAAHVWPKSKILKRVLQATFAHSVMCVVARCSNEQMRRVDTQPDVASVADKKPFRDRPSVPHITRSMGVAFSIGILSAHPAIAVRCTALPRPDPTAVGVDSVVQFCHGGRIS